ncbi:MAG: hypothetical protein CMH30_00985 [Micavibrio sp.]|nr:hypothetical protein [Micavibrio sp.]|tara:strand:+ start:404 stop:820 length:417 start_codon:yes stop_codon:yes gene_type:complete
MLKKTFFLVFFAAVLYIVYQLSQPCYNMTVDIVNESNEIVEITLFDPTTRDILVQAEILPNNKIKRHISIIIDVKYNVTIRDQQDKILRKSTYGYDSVMLDFYSKIIFDGKNIEHEYSLHGIFLTLWHMGNLLLRCTI